MPESLRSLRERLDEKFAAVGMKRVPATDSGFIYDDLIAKLLAQGRIEFDRESFRTMCQQEGLLEPSGQPQDVLAIGIRSFIKHLEKPRRSGRGGKRFAPQWQQSFLD